jgi:hypothetical protein
MRRFGTHLLAAWLAVLPAVQAAPATDACPPIAPDSVRFAVIGDSGTGGDDQYEVAAQLAQSHAVFPFEFVIMLGDNLYGSERPQDFVRKFERPYAPLLEAGVDFYASLGNHDDPNQRFYKPFNMDGKRYYSFTRKGARFFALDSSYFDEEQRRWLERELTSSRENWKLAFFHHPLYSSGAKHGAEEDLRALVEPLFVSHGVSVVFAGHEHFYERLKPQKGIYHFISGAAAKLRRGNLRRTPQTARGLDSEYSFMLVEIADDTLSFQTITKAGRRFDSGVLQRRGATPPQTAQRAADVTPLVCRAAA